MLSPVQGVYCTPIQYMVECVVEHAVFIRAFTAQNIADMLALTQAISKPKVHPVYQRGAIHGYKVACEVHGRSTYITENMLERMA